MRLTFRGALCWPAGGACVFAIVAGVGIAAAGEGIAGSRILMLLALAPIMEEAVFRAGLHEALLRRASPPLANVATALAFGAAHAMLRAIRQAWPSRSRRY